MSIAKSVGFGATPTSNTGSFSQNPKNNPKFSSRLDWLQGVFRIDSELLPKFIDFLSSTFADTFAPDSGSFFCGRSFGHHRLSDRHARIAWNCVHDFSYVDSNGDSIGFYFADVFLMLPARFLVGCPNFSALRDFILALASHSFKPTRIDLAIDDYSKSLNWSHFDSAFDDGFAHGFQQVDLRTPKSKLKDCGFTYYMGSTGSDKMHRFYDKSVESNGEIDAFRLEGQYKNGWAKSIFQCLLSASNEAEFHQRIVDCVCTPIDFYQITDDGEKIFLDWWVSFKELVKAGSASINCGRLKKSIDDSINWVESSVETTLANIECFMSRVGVDFAEWLNDRLESGRRRLRSVHQNKIDAALAALGIPSYLSGDDLREGYF